ncbi:MAG TPA: vitamin K epoxide reductase family protein [Rubrobacter sp.]|nr:vitamin K epoxide reductase family protein [Rubrobacter sp.]
MVSHERVSPENGFLRAALGGLAVAGLLVSAYLTWAHLVGAEPVCGLGGGGCRAVQASRYAAVLGIPVPMLGLAGYAGLLLAAILRGEVGAYLGLLVVLVGALFSAYLTYLEIFVIGAICQWCVASAAIMFGALVCASLRVASLPKDR